MVVFEQAQQLIPFVKCETSFGWDVGKLVFGIDVFDLDFGSWKHVSLWDSFF